MLGFPVDAGRNSTHMVAYYKLVINVLQAAVRFSPISHCSLANQDQSENWQIEEDFSISLLHEAYMANKLTVSATHFIDFTNRSILAFSLGAWALVEG